jgi:hypothetical protein
MIDSAAFQVPIPWRQPPVRRASYLFRRSAGQTLDAPRCGSIYNGFTRIAVYGREKHYG